MNTKADIDSGSRLDTVKLVIAIAVLSGGIVAFYALEAQALWVRLLVLLAVLGGAVAITLQTQIGRSAWSFLSEARVEVRKVVWPTRQETLQTTLIIIVAVLITALFLWAVDSILFWIVRSLTGQGG